MRALVKAAMLHCESVGEFSGCLKVALCIEEIFYQVEMTLKDTAHET